MIGARPNSEARLSATAVHPAMTSAACSPGGQHQPIVEAVGQLDGEALVGSRVAEPGPERLAAGQLTGPVGQPRLAVPRRRLVDAGLVGRRMGDVLGCSHRRSAYDWCAAGRRRTSRSGPATPPRSRWCRRRRWSTRSSPSVESMSTRTTAPVAAPPSSTRTLKSVRWMRSSAGYRPLSAAPHGHVEGVDRAVALPHRRDALAVDPQLHRGLDRDLDLVDRHDRPLAVVARSPGRPRPRRSPGSIRRPGASAARATRRPPRTASPATRAP